MPEVKLETQRTALGCEDTPRWSAAHVATAMEPILIGGHGSP